MSIDPLELARRALAGRDAWLVGGAVRDRQLGRESIDVDVVVDMAPAEAARAIAEAARTAGQRPACFALSEEFGAWRVTAAGGAWQIDVEALRGGSLAADLALRDFTVNAIAEPLAGGEPIDPLGGCADLQAGRLRQAGPRAFADDPLRVLRLVRVAVELDLKIDPETLDAAREQAQRMAEVSPERVFLELRRILACNRAVLGLALTEQVGAAAVVLPELVRLHGVEQSRYHHRDVHGHTLEVLERVVALTGGTQDFSGLLGPDNADAVARLLAEPLADGLTRGEALRWGALLHDAAKPATRAVRPLDRRVTFFGHDAVGARLARDVLGRLRASVRLREHVAGLVRWHLRLGFLVHERQPLAREQVYAYLRDCEPVEVDVTLLSVCDRLATRGAKAERAIEAHLALAREMLADTLAWRERGAPKPLLRGDELAAALGVARGPRVGELLERLVEAQFTGRVSTREQALAFVQGL
ncbi:MAG TPA: HD domain-containing protein [Solirubrobacteraceae bacterium]|nr:HD domain-containing protein [Solirubrobacteraceae bacterium]